VLGPDRAGEREHEVADQRADQDGGDRLREAEARDEVRTGLQHEQPDAEIRPEHEVVEETEDAKRVRHALDADRGGAEVVPRGGERLRDLTHGRAS